MTENKKPRILILEDDEIRTDLFQKLLVNADVEIYTDVNEAIENYGTSGDYDLLLLDHDLGGEVFVSSAHENTGAAFCRWLTGTVAETSELPTIVIHSHNPVGAMVMNGYIPHAVQLPFSKTLLGVLYNRYVMGAQ